jgi:polyhydroxyalkanoate synthesis regulator phasin
MKKMKKIIKWRLKELPTPETLDKLVKIGILSKDEARQILFSEEETDTKEERSIDGLKEEIKFLRELVEKLSISRDKTVEIIREVEKTYCRGHWYKPYEIWCSSGNSFTYTGVGNSGIGINESYSGGGADTSIILPNSTNSAQDFSKIKTF